MIKKCWFWKSVLHILAALVLEYACGEKQTYHRHKVLRVYPKNDQHLNLLKTLHSQNHYQLDFWREPRSTSAPIDVRVHPKYEKLVKSLLQSSSITHEVSIEDLQSVVDQLMGDGAYKDKFSPYNLNYSKYHTYDNIVSWMRVKTRNNSDIASLVEVGTTYEGRSIYAVKISVDVGEKKAVWLDGGIHAREWIAPATMVYFIGHILDLYGIDPDITYILGKLDLYIVPVFNVDGYIYSWTTDRLWRKTRSPNAGSKCIGTDPNRNWNYHWGEATFMGMKASPCSSLYPGSAPFSEREVRTVSEYLLKLNGTLQSYLSYHNYGQLMMFPYGYTHRKIQDYNELMQLCKKARYQLYQVHGTIYSCGSLHEIVGNSSGSSVDYTYGVLKVKYSFGIELRDEGVLYFLQPEKQIVPNAEESFAAFKSIASHVIKHLKHS